MVTVRDVARVAGVSISTVSRALSAPHLVAAPTRDRVAAIADDLGYRPNRAAAGLRAGRTGAIGLLVPDLANPYFAAVAKGVAERAREHGLGAFVVDSDEDAVAEVDVLRGLAHQTDGVILASPRAVDADLAAVEGKPVVVVNQDGPHAVVSDVAAGVHLALDHLRALGHQRIAYVGGPASSWSDARRREALRTAQGAGSAARDVVTRDVVAREVVTLGAFAPTVDGGAAAADAVVASGATAVITFNDVVAVGLIRAVRERGLRVPQDLSVVGCDDTFLAPLVTPALTSIGWDLRELGRSAAEVLAALLQGADDAPATLTLPGVLTVRDSTAPAPGPALDATPPSRPARG